MALPLPGQPGLPLPPAAAPGYDPRADEGRATHVEKLVKIERSAYNLARVRIGSNYVTLTRAQCFHLIGQLERVAGEI